jgi:hypothetical protein
VEEGRCVLYYNLWYALHLQYCFVCSASSILLRMLCIFNTFSYYMSHPRSYTISSLACATLSPACHSLSLLRAILSPTCRSLSCVPFSLLRATLSPACHSLSYLPLSLLLAILSPACRALSCRPCPCLPAVPLLAGRAPLLRYSLRSVPRLAASAPSLSLEVAHNR